MRLVQLCDYTKISSICTLEKGEFYGIWNKSIEKLCGVRKDEGIDKKGLTVKKKMCGKSTHVPR